MPFIGLIMGVLFSVVIFSNEIIRRICRLFSTGSQNRRFPGKAKKCSKKWLEYVIMNQSIRWSTDKVILVMRVFGR